MLRVTILIFLCEFLTFILVETTDNNTNNPINPTNSWNMTSPANTTCSCNKPSPCNFTSNCNGTDSYEPSDSYRNDYCYKTDWTNTTNSCNSTNCNCNARPNIIYIMADDLGWNDISLHGNREICTPNIEALLTLGREIDGLYSDPMCTPSRGATLTGKCSYRLGLHCTVISASQARCLPLNVSTLPQLLKKCGYKTALIGKWHLGSCSNSCMPLQRGYDYFFGFILGKVDARDGTIKERTAVNTTNPKVFHGFHVYKGNSLCYKYSGEHLTDVITRKAVKYIRNHNCSQPFYLQVNHLAPHAGNDYWYIRALDEYIKKFKKCIDTECRRNLTAMIYQLDKGVGEIFQALNDTGLINCTLVIFTSDNGGTNATQEYTCGTNYPYRGEKSSTWQGGVKIVGGIWYPCFCKEVQSKKILGYFHLIDWVPTILAAAKCNCSGCEPCNFDGINQWDNFATGNVTSRKKFVIFDVCSKIAAVFWGKYKLVINATDETINQNRIVGVNNRCSTKCQCICNETTVVESPTAKILSQFLGVVYNECNVIARRAASKVNCSISVKGELKNPIANGPAPVFNITSNNITTRYYLFDMYADPCEQINLYVTKPDIVKVMLAYFESEMGRQVRPNNTKSDNRADPKNFNCTFGFWCDYYGLTVNKPY